MTASALAGELRLPLHVAQDSLQPFDLGLHALPWPRDGTPVHPVWISQAAAPG